VGRVGCGTKVVRVRSRDAEGLEQDLYSGSHRPYLFNPSASYRSLPRPFLFVTAAVTAIAIIAMGGQDIYCVLEVFHSKSVVSIAIMATVRACVLAVAPSYWCILRGGSTHAMASLHTLSMHRGERLD